MSKLKYRLIPVEDPATWDAFAEKSLNHTIFSSSAYLQAMGRRYALFFVFKGQQPKAGVALVLDETGERGILDDLVVYSGLLFEKNPGQKEVRARAERFEVTEFIINELSTRYASVAMSLPPGVEDLRAFLWHNYHETSTARKFRVELRYTSYLDISQFFLRNPDQQTLLYQEVDNTRQSDLRKAEGSDSSVQEERDPSTFCNLYDRLMNSQRVGVSAEMLERISVLIDHLIKQDLARMYVVRDARDHVTYATVFTKYMNIGCYLFGAGDQEMMKRYDGTLCVWESLRQISRLGVRLVDMEGINSPQRGAFKLSFGGTIEPYHEVFLNS